MNATPAGQAPGRVPLSILDLVPVWQGGSIREAFEASLALAVAADRAGYARLWYAAVSYTHLDVYKRQPPQQTRGISRRQEICGAGRTTRPWMS